MDWIVDFSGGKSASDHIEDCIDLLTNEIENRQKIDFVDVDHATTQGIMIARAILTQYYEENC